MLVVYVSERGCLHGGELSIIYPLVHNSNELVLQQIILIEAIVRFRLRQVTFTLSEAAAELGMIDGAGQLYRKSRRGGSATLQQLPGVIFMPEGAAGVAGIFNSSPETEAISDRGSTTEMRVKTFRLLRTIT